MLTMLLACKVGKLLLWYPRGDIVYFIYIFKLQYFSCIYPRVLRFTYYSGQSPVEGIDSDTIEFEVLNSEFNDMSQFYGVLACTGM